MKLEHLAEIRQGLVTAGRGVGARKGDWKLDIVESSNLVDDRVQLEGLREVQVLRSERTEEHLLHPYDLLVTARSQTIKVALVPPRVSRTVAASTLLVVRVPDPGSGLAHFLWYYLASTGGRTKVASRVTATTLPTLSARALGDVDIPVPPRAELHRYADLVEASEDAYGAAVEAAACRRELLRDAIVAASLMSSQPTHSRRVAP